MRRATDPSASPSSPHLSWRKRRPILSRVVLYGLGGLLIGAALLLLRHRREQDARDHDAYLHARLEALDVLFAAGGGQGEILKVLDEEFSGEDLSPTLRQRALRVRAQVLAKGEKWDEARAAFDQAASIDADDAAKEALGLERAWMEMEQGHFEEALALLGTEPLPGPTLETFRLMERFAALKGLERKAEGREALRRFLDGLPRPLPPEIPIYVGMAPQTPASAVRTAAGLLTADAKPDRAAALWQGLLEMLPEDFPAHLVAVRGLQAAGREVEAAKAWARARLLDPQAAERAEAADPDLARLTKDLQDSLKSRDEAGR